MRTTILLIAGLILLTIFLRIFYGSQSEKYTKSEYIDLDRVNKKLLDTFNKVPPAVDNVVPMKQGDKVGYNCALDKPIAMSKRNGVWSMMLSRKSTCEVAVYGAYYDDRRSKYSEHFIRIVGVTTCPEYETIYCQLWYRNEVVTVSPSKENIGRGMIRENIRYQERLYSCLLPTDGRVPDAVALSHNPCEQAFTFVNVTVPSKKREHAFGVCVVVAYGTVIPTRLIEWVEWMQLLGVTEINVYNSSLHIASLEVLKHYLHTGLMWIGQSAPPLNDWCFFCQKLAAIAVLNDCIYRNMYRYEYAVVVDFDEIIVPRLDDNYHALINRLSTASLTNAGNSSMPAVDFEFRNAYFFFEFGPFSNQINLFSARYLHRLQPSAIGYSPKSIINPRWCVVMQNHYCTVRLEGYGGQYVYHVPETFALSHHYKFCVSSWTEEECKQEMKNQYVRDNAAHRFQTSLFENTDATYYSIYHKHIQRGDIGRQ